MVAAHWDGPGLEAWAAWSPEEVAKVLAGTGVPWCVVGGWALELWFGESYRSHGDIEIAIPGSHFPIIRNEFKDYRIHVVGDGEVRFLPGDEMPPEDKHQVWVLEPAPNLWRLDIMLEPGNSQTWIARRDDRVRCPRDAIVGLRDGIPFLKPEGVLFFKAKHCRDKDQLDFDTCAPGMDTGARNWLINALQLAHPGHVWIELLSR